MAQGRTRQAPDFSPVASLTPVARPVDTYSGAPVNEAMQLAGALRDLNPNLQNWIGYKADQQSEADFQAGQQAYMSAKSNLKDAVNKGTVQAGFSPAFQRGYQQGQLRVMGLDYDQQLRTAYSASDAASSSDPHAFQGFLQDFTSKYLQQNIGADFHPVDVSKAFTPAMDAAQRSLSQFHVEQQAKTIEDNWEQTTQDEISKTMDNAVANGMSAEQTGGAVNTVIANAMSNGWHDKKAFNQNIINLVTAKAMGSGNAGLLDVLQHIPTGPGSVLGNTTYARDKALEASQRIQNQGRDDIRWQWAQSDHDNAVQAHQWAVQEHAHTMQDWAIEKSAGTLMRAMVAQAVIDPTQNFDKQVLQLTNMDKDGSHARSFLAFKDTMLNTKANGYDKPEAVTSIYQDMLNHPQTFDPSAIVAARNAGNISIKTMQNLMDDQRRIAESGASPLLHDPVYNTLKDGVLKAFQGDPNEYDVTKVEKTTDNLMSFQRHALDYISKNKANLDPNKFYDEMKQYKDHLTHDLLEAEKKKPKAGAQAQPQGKPNPYAQPGMSH